MVINLVATGAPVGRQQAGELIQGDRQPVMDAGVIGQLLVEPGNLLWQLGLAARQRLDKGHVGGLTVTETIGATATTGAAGADGGIGGAG